MAWLEAFGAAMAVAIQICAVRRSRLAFVLTMLNAVVYAVVFITARLMFSVSLQIMFFAIACYGFWYWGQGRDSRRVSVTSFGFSRTLASMLLFLLLSFAFALSLGDISGARHAQLDASVAGLSVLGELLLSRKKRETWIVFALAYGVGIYTYVISDLFFTAALCGFLMCLCIIGWRSWRASEPADQCSGVIRAGTWV